MNATNTWPELDIQSLTPEAARLAETLTVSPVLAQLLHNRGIDAHDDSASRSSR